MKLHRTFVLFVVLLASAARADVVIQWNAIASDALVSNVPYQNPGMASRSLAMVNLAIHDAVGLTTGEFGSFYQHNLAGSGASTEAAAAVAAHSVLSHIYPDQQSMLDAALSNSLMGVAAGPARDLGIQWGTQIGQTVAARRQNDGFDSGSNYVVTNGPGHWSPDPMNPSQTAWGPAWGSMQPFAISSLDPHRPPAPPELTSQEYADSFNEVRSLGELNSATRTPEQTEIGLFWAYDRVGMGTPMRLFNAILRTIATDQQNTTTENAQLFAISSVAMADAGIVAWDSKFDHDLWRPITGIREADTDGNPLTEADEDWIPLGAPGGGFVNDFTPSFPAYVSGHATFGAAMFRSIEHFYGTDELDFTITSDETPGITRSFTRLSDASIENGRSRIYLGVHWDFDDYLGRAAGNSIADAIFARPFVAIPEPSTLVLAAVAFAGLVTVVRRW